ncbi:MAG: hypothetical protein QHH10_02100 [Peptococcaceae bacterium]|nr:hypothetical protein [Peptococcaceae bacterium]MDH7524090.1 hypothetical protein [Peptococcaceae bacterium]
MAAVFENHHKCYAASRMVGDIVFSKEFCSLREELSSVYRRLEIRDAEKEAFQDALYSFLTQKVEVKKRLLSLVRRDMVHESNHY